MKNKKVLVTGEKGFIGPNLVPELERKGHEIWVCDLRHSEGENYVRCDVSKYRQVEKVLGKKGIFLKIWR